MMSSLVRERIIKYLRKKHYLALSFLSLVFFAKWQTSVALLAASSALEFSPPLFRPLPHFIFLHLVCTYTIFSSITLKMHSTKNTNLKRKPMRPRPTRPRIESARSTLTARPAPPPTQTPKNISYSEEKNKNIDV